MFLVVFFLLVLVVLIFILLLVFQKVAAKSKIVTAFIVVRIIAQSILVTFYGFAVLFLALQNHTEVMIGFSKI